MTDVERYSSKEVEDLIERLETVNTITGIASIIERCRDAARYIENAERVLYEIRKETNSFTDWAKSSFK